MAQAKWPVWAVGIASVATFVTLLNFTQPESDNEFTNSTEQEPIQTGPLKQQAQVGSVTVKFYTASRAEFEESVSNADATAQQQRIVELSTLDWTSSSGTVQSIDPIKNENSNRTYTVIEQRKSSSSNTSRESTRKTRSS